MKGFGVYKAKSSGSVVNFWIGGGWGGVGWRNALIIEMGLKEERAFLNWTKNTEAHHASLLQHPD